MATGKLLALGLYSDLPLRQARERRDNTPKLLANGTDPGAVKQAEKTKGTGLDTFDSVAAEWMGKNAPHWSEQHAAFTRNTLDVDLSPILGRIPVNTITAATLGSMFGDDGNEWTQLLPIDRKCEQSVARLTG